MRALRNPFRSLPPEVVVLTAVAFSVALGFGVVAPSIPLFAREFGVSNFAAGAVVSVFALVRFVSAPLAGRMVNRLGERWVLATGIGIVGVSSLLAGLAGSYAQLVILRGIGGLGSAMFTVSSFALLLRVVTPDQRGRAAGTYQTGFLLGGIAGPAFGGPLTAWSLRAPFFVYAVTLLVAGAVAMVFLAHTALREHEAAAGTADVAPTSTRDRGAQLGIPGRGHQQLRGRLGHLRCALVAHPPVRRRGSAAQPGLDRRRPGAVRGGPGARAHPGGAAGRHPRTAAVPAGRRGRRDGCRAS